jgi:2-haloacid dehalogenase
MTAHAGFPFDDVISVAAAGSFKPHVATSRTACELTGLAAGGPLRRQPRVRLVGAKSFGMRTAFVNRRDRPSGEKPYLPNITVADSAELAATMTPRDLTRRAPR